MGFAICAGGEMPFLLCHNDPHKAAGSHSIFLCPRPYRAGKRLQGFFHAKSAQFSPTAFPHLPEHHR